MPSPASPSPLRAPLLALALAATGLAQTTPPAPAGDQPATPTPEQVAALHALAESLWNDYAPESVKAEYELIGRDELLAFFQRLESAGQEEDLAKFAAYAPETRAAIASLRSQPDFADYAAWLADRLDEMEAAATLAAEPPQPPPPPPPPVRPSLPQPPAPPKPAFHPSTIPHYALWLGRVAKRPRPPRADEFLPAVRAAFAAEGVPEALVWLAETESGFNPRARSPAGARGLFQLMPATARELGLDLWPGDQRTDPKLSAAAAARLLRQLHARFGDWPLALAAYNAGPGRVSRELKKRDATAFAAISAHLPAETRLYVPKVLATVETRAGVAPSDLPAPTSAAAR